MHANELPFTPEAVEAAAAPLIRIRLGSDGGPVEATAARLIAAPVKKLWSVISDVSSYATRVPMMDAVRLDGALATVHLKFGVSLFSTRFSFRVERHLVEGRSVELRYVDGEPHNLNIRFDLLPASVATHSVLYVRVGFDIFSLGWLAKYFLKNHPEIRNGVYPGSAFTLLDTMTRAAEGR